jgi:hypothetical protein
MIRAQFSLRGNLPNIQMKAVRDGIVDIAEKSTIFNGIMTRNLSNPRFFHEPIPPPVHCLKNQRLKIHLDAAEI